MLRQSRNPSSIFTSFVPAWRGRVWPAGWPEKRSCFVNGSQPIVFQPRGQGPRGSGFGPRGWISSHATSPAKTWTTYFSTNTDSNFVVRAPDSSALSGSMINMLRLPVRCPWRQSVLVRPRYGRAHSCGTCIHFSCYVTKPMVTNNTRPWPVSGLVDRSYVRSFYTWLLLRIPASSSIEVRRGCGLQLFESASRGCKVPANDIAVDHD